MKIIKLIIIMLVLPSVLYAEKNANCLAPYYGINYNNLQSLTLQLGFVYGSYTNDLPGVYGITGEISSGLTGDAISLGFAEKFYMDGSFDLPLIGLSGKATLMRTREFRKYDLPFAPEPSAWLLGFDLELIVLAKLHAGIYHTLSKDPVNEWYLLLGIGLEFGYSW